MNTHNCIKVFMLYAVPDIIRTILSIAGFFFKKS